jgi:hypothetical protein
MNRCTVSEGTCSAQVPEPKIETLGDELDYRIAVCRKNLESICITKAKAEAAQLLNTPIEFIRRCAYHPF